MTRRVLTFVAALAEFEVVLRERHHPGDYNPDRSAEIAELLERAHGAGLR